MSSINPLLSESTIPFTHITPDHVRSGVRSALTKAQEDLDAILANPNPTPTYEDTLGALQALLQAVQTPMRTTYHLMNVAYSDELCEAFEEVQPEYSRFMAELPLNDALWQLLKRYQATDEVQTLRPIYKRFLDKIMRQFIHQGADLPPEEKERVRDIYIELSQLHTKFGNNLLEGTNAFELVIDDETELAGLPESHKQQAKQNAAEKGLTGYRFTLQMPSLLPFMQYIENRAHRETMYKAFDTRGNNNKVDNTPLVTRILALRHELAERLSFESYADYTLADRMVSSSHQALAFEKELEDKTRDYFARDIQSLTDFAYNTLGIDTLQPWDVSFVQEKMRQILYAFDQDVLRPFFALDKVIQGFFDLVRDLFGVTITRVDNPEVWNDAIEFYELYNHEGVHVGSFYTDWFPRESKRSGAWKFGLKTGGPQSDGSFTPHLGAIATNFTPPQNGNPALLTHDEVQTLYHEFGHLMHYLLSEVEVPELAGTNVAHDFVELPSQIMENWCWEKAALDRYAAHIDTGEPIPNELFDKMMVTRTFMGGYIQMRQLSFGTVDLLLHSTYNPKQDLDALEYGRNVLTRFQVRPEFASRNFLTSFGHVFAGGYAAGYYAYKWSEVLDADAFTRFKAEGIFNPKTGHDFVSSILSRGDSADPNELYHEFMGRDPDVEALLTRNLGPLSPQPSS